MAETTHVPRISEWIIRSTDRHSTETLYWSNDFGYTDRGSATRFTDNEKNTLRLPLEGEWIEDNDDL